ncbi:hypothetical protein [Roseiarcus sp.]|uniref:hypothetical protein n=1 Tax=Roseiarcus sp. TaxID=1969460 RepID=UPI003F9C9B18
MHSLTKCINGHNPDDLANLARRLFDLAHRVDRLPHDLDALLRIVSRDRHNINGVLRPLGCAACGDGNLVQRRSGLLEA